ncbi:MULTISPECIES: DUF3422 family protein [Roseobacteraceae]|jgi:uncharacterized membrane-anchored protein|uniref:Egg lysin n=1 Tax=Pseudosulfitobacter pseudonitzschiae TaxID=1402135 RepID=A0A221K161_9RHOB|nr:MULTISPECIES: DUF3422 domain-containing protein [Roseobacteraceae]ASM72711.1 egg lysin [Pseudosulfitobacter pseudonitzschiae]
MPPVIDHPLRHRLTSELHARPFPVLNAPAMAAYLAIKHSPDDTDRAAALAQLTALLDHYGAPRPDPGATHYVGPMGKYSIKWEQHTEFVTYTVFQTGLSDRPFDPAEFEVFPAHWQDSVPGARITSALFRVMPRPEDDGQIVPQLDNWLVTESIAVADVLDGSAVVASDFRIDPAGHMRFAVYVSATTGPGRVGRIVQRLCEIETYKSMSLLGFAKARELAGQLNRLDTQLNDLTEAMRSPDARAEETLHALLDVSVALEQQGARSAYRFAATGAYAALVAERIAVLREARFLGRQSFAEFMMRRYEPAMRTVRSAEARLNAMSNRAIRASELLRTQVDVERSAQNQAILASMDRRSDLQLRLQRTVEGLSVVAVSYYAVSLVGYLLYPLAEHLGVSKGMMTAAVTLPVIGLVWLMLHRIKRHVE